MINSLPRKKVDQYDNMITTKVINFEIIKQRRYLQGSFSKTRDQCIVLLPWDNYTQIINVQVVTYCKTS